MSEIADRQKLIKYIKAEEYDAAYTFLKGLPLSANWCDSAVSIYIALNKSELADQTLIWAKENAGLLMWRRCIYEYAKACWIKLWGHKPTNLLISPGVNDPEIFLKINEILNVINPVLKHIEGDQTVESELESKILFIAINSFWIKGDIEKVRELSSYLVFMKPASLGLANLALLGLVNKKDLSPNFSERIIRDYPDSFNATMLSNMLRAEIFNQAEDAFIALKKYSISVNKKDTEQFFGGLFHVAKLIGQKEVRETISLATELLGGGNLLGKFAEAELFLNNGQIEEAEKIIIEFKDEDNLLWLQLNAFLQAEKGNFEDAIQCFEKSALNIIHPEMFATFGRMATKASKKDKKYLDKVIEAYNHLIELQPDNIEARHNLSFALLRAGEIQKAEKHFKYLSENLTETVYRQNYAFCLVSRNAFERALKIYDQICEGENISVEVILAKTKLLKQIHTPIVAFNFIDKYREEFWGNPLYLQSYIKTAYQADRDQNAHNAFTQLRKLQATGKTSSEVIQEKTIDDFKEYFDAQNKRERNIGEFYLKGQLPWTFIDAALHKTVCNGWFVRTQMVDWINEEPCEIAKFSLYSTNSLHPIKSKSGKIYIEKIDTPELKIEIVLDISSIITLHKLGLLNKVNDFFETVFIPSIYISKLTSDSDDLLFHQLSNVEAVRKIKNSIDDQKIKILDNFGPKGNRALPYVNEHTMPESDDEHFYRLTDIISLLNHKGLLKKRLLNDIKKIILKPSGVDDIHPPIELNSKIVIEPSSLRTLCDLRLFELVIRNFTIMLTKDSRDQIFYDFKNIQYQVENQRFNNELISILSGNDFEKIDIRDNDPEMFDFSTASHNLKMIKEAPLFADCRSLQMLSLNDNSKHNAFGTDQFLNTLYSQSLIDIEDYTKLYLQLMEWRYKFLLPPIEILNYLVGQYSNHPPGIELNQIAGYVQECMIDPGLFHGQEKSAEVPLPISIKLYLELLQLSTDFIINCWTNDSLSDAEAEEYTDWALLSLLPTFPKFLPDFTKSNIASMTKQVLLSGSIMKLITLQHPDISNKILLSLKNKLQLNDIEYNKIIAGSLDAIG